MFRISWEFPAQDSIDPERQAKADFQRLKNGETTFAELLGPDWRGQFRELSAELAEAKALGLPLDIFDTVAGAPARTSAQTQTEE
jgi:capsid protein